jgi:glucose-6-phosphate 1-dehydrogenase
VTATEATIRWKRGACPVLEESSPPAPNYVRFRLGPDNVIALGANVKKDGPAMIGERAELVLRRSPADEMKPYERLIGDALDGDPSLFADQQAVEQSWRVVDPIAGKGQVFPYEPGSWGPREAERIQPEGGWSDPR